MPLSAALRQHGRARFPFPCHAAALPKGATREGESIESECVEDANLAHIVGTPGDGHRTPDAALIAGGGPAQS